ncbi:MAG: DNA/RNA non-specific endonuclease [bacterium]
MPRSLLLLSCMVALLAITSPLSPALADPEIDHDRWHTAPTDLSFEGTAFIGSFDSEDDDNGDGTPDHRGEAEWVAYQIDALAEELGTAPSRPGWTWEESWAEQGISPRDSSYKGNITPLGLERGHLCMSQIGYRRGDDAALETFTLSNACPQDSGLNGGVWEGLERLTEVWSDEYGTVWVVCGPLFYKKKVRLLGNSNQIKVRIPDGFYKIVIRDDGNGDGLPEVMAFSFDQVAVHYKRSYMRPKSEYQAHFTSVDRIEAVTGLDFLTTLDEGDQELVESEKTSALWPLPDAADMSVPIGFAKEPK